MTYQLLIPKIAEVFGLRYIEVASAQKGYRNESYLLSLVGGEEVNLIFHKIEYEAHMRISSADKASSILASKSFPVRVRYDRRTLKLSDGRKEVYAGLYTYLPGSTIPWEAYTMNNIKLLGWAMSDMHSIWRQSEKGVPMRIDDELMRLCAHMENYFDSPSVQQAMKSKLLLSLEADFPQYEKLFELLRSKTRSDEHILHMDLVRGNVLFGSATNSPWSIEGVSISGIIDFEKAAIGHPVYDIARTLAFLLVDCVSKDRQSIFKYFLQSGYNKRGSSSFKRGDTIGGIPAYRVLNTLISFFLLHDFYKFLRHTPYESLEANHHYVRTRNILVDYGMIRLIKTETTMRGK